LYSGRRTTGDIGNNWGSVDSIINSNNNWADYAGPGAFNDPDMLEVGNEGMNEVEEQSHFSLWALSKSPLLIGCDLTKISDSSLAILSNAEVIALNQDSKGVQGRRVWSSEETGRSILKVKNCDDIKGGRR
jgi:alpha-galactosidase